MNSKKPVKDEIDYVNAVYKLIEVNKISAYSYSLESVNKNPEKLSSAEVEFKDTSLEAMENNIKLLKDAGIKIVDYNPDIGQFLVYGRPGPLNRVRKSEEITTFDIITLEHGPL